MPDTHPNIVLNSVYFFNDNRLFSEKPILAKEAMYIEEYIKLLKRQKLMEVSSVS